MAVEAPRWRRSRAGRLARSRWPTARSDGRSRRPPPTSGTTRARSTSSSTRSRYGAVGATANPTIVTDVWKGDPAPLARSRPGARATNAGAPPRSTSRGPSSRRCRSGRRRSCCPAFEASGGRQGRLSMQTDPTFFRAYDRMLGAGHRLRSAWPRTSSSSSRPRPVGVAGHGGGDLPRRQRQRHRLVQRRAGRRRGRGGRARPPPARGRGPADRRHGPGHHADDGPARGLAARPDRARRDRRRSDASCRGRASRSSSGPTRSSGRAGCGPGCWAPRSAITSTGRS